MNAKGHKFVFRLSRSGKAIHRTYPTHATEAFPEGHIEEFNEICGVPVRHISHDNLTSAIASMIIGQVRKRRGNVRRVLFRSLYGSDPFYCQPGISGDHEEVKIEGEGPVPSRQAVPEACCELP